MPLSIGVNLRVTGHCNQGGRKYMEDMFSVAYQQSSNDRELEYAFFGIFDGHGGGEAAIFAKEHLMDIIVKQKNFWSDNDEDVLKAIRDGYVNTHYAMWRELDKWPRTASGLPSTAGTTASIAFIRKGKIYIGHVGDSAIILGYQDKDDPVWKSRALTKDHKPECGVEMSRIHESGGKVVSKSGVPRVVWNRPRLGHKGPVRRSTHIDEIPFLAVARSLGDLWSYNSELNRFVVSPEPDVKVIEIDVKTHRCLIFGTDGLWNMLTPQAAVAIVQAAEKHNEKHLIASQQTGSGQRETQMWINPSKSLVDRALDRWSSTRLRADNTSVVTLMLDPPGPTHSEILLSQRREQVASTKISTPEPVYTPIMQEVIHHPIQSNSSTEKHSVDSLKTPLITKSDIQKYPDSSNPITNDETTTCPIEENNKNTSLSKETLNQSSKSIEESIQVAEISSSNVSDDQQNIDLDRSIVEAEIDVVESSISEENEPNTSTNDDEENSKFFEQKSWLQEVPEAERFPTNNTDLQPIKHSKPPEYLRTRLKRSCVYQSTPKNSFAKRIGSSSSNSCNGKVLRQTNEKRRHSSGQPQNCLQKRSLTTKSSSCLPSLNKKVLKRSCRVLLGDELDNTKNNGNRSFEVIEENSSSEPCPKRKTRSEDIKNMQDENNPANQKVEPNKLRWPVIDTSKSKTNQISDGVLNLTNNHSPPNSFKRRSLEKKATPVKTIKRPTINRSTVRTQITRDGFWDQSRTRRTTANCSSNRRQTVISILSNSAISEAMSTSSSSSTPKRWLRSDTIAATPIKTLRSRNVDIAGHTVSPQVAGQYDIVKSNRPTDSATKLSKHMTTPIESNFTMIQTPQNLDNVKVKIANSSTTHLTTPQNKKNQNYNASITSGSSISLNSSTPTALITKRNKTPYNPSARSLSTRTRRFNK